MSWSKRLAAVVGVVTLTALLPSTPTFAAVKPSTHATARDKVHIQHRRRALDEKTLKQAKAVANDRATKSTLAPATSSSVNAAPNVYNAWNFQGLQGDGTFIPPDSTGAVGPEISLEPRIAEMVNARGATFVSSGQPPDTRALFDLAYAHDTDCVFDPQIEYD